MFDRVPNTPLVHYFHKQRFYKECQAETPKS